MDVAGGERGAALPVVLIILGIMVITVLAVAQWAAGDAILVRRDAHAIQAHWTAEAGLQVGETWLRAQEDLPESPVCLFGDEVDTLQVDRGVCDVVVAPDFTGARTVYTVTATAEAGTRTRVLESDISPCAFTDYLYYVNRNTGPGECWFYTGEVIDGPLHLDDMLGIIGNPVFTAHVESAADQICYYNEGTYVYSSDASNPPTDIPDFQDGYTLGTTDMNWIGQSELHVVKDMADLTLNGNHELVFGQDAEGNPAVGVFSYTKAGKNKWSEELISNLDNGIIYCGGNVEVSGIVEGQVTVVSNGQMDIVDDLVVYDSDGDAPAEGCDDLIGLVVGSKLIVDDTEPNCDDCVIHACVFAINNQGCFVSNYNHGSPRGTLTLYGSIAQDKWGPVGTGIYQDGELTIFTGYERDFHYDWRLRTMLPPGIAEIAFDDEAMLRVAWRDVTPR